MNNLHKVLTDKQLLGEKTKTNMKQKKQSINILF
jgi:Flp pilus assembly protein TadB